MITTIQVNTIDDVMRLISDQTRNGDINRLRSEYYYRGQPDARYRMVTSLWRNCGSRPHELEPSILRYFKYSTPLTSFRTDSSSRTITSAVMTTLTSLMSTASASTLTLLTA